MSSNSLTPLPPYASEAAAPEGSRTGSTFSTTMNEMARRHFWKVAIVCVIVLGALWLAPKISRQEPALPVPAPAPMPSTAPAPGTLNSAFEGRTAAPLLYHPDPVPAAKQVAPVAKAKPMKGKASFYGGEFHGRRTANGERYDQNSLTAAHRTLPMGTKVKVKNLRNGREVVVRINNRGPYVKGRIIDLSSKAAKDLRMTGAGVVPVEVTVLPKETVPAQKSTGPMLAKG